MLTHVALPVQYLGAFRDEAAAARAYDLACLAAKGRDRAILNFPTSDYLDAALGTVLRADLPWPVPPAMLAALKRARQPPATSLAE